MKTLAERLVHARITSGYSDQVAAAKAAGLTPSALNQLESGETRSMKAVTAMALADAYPRFNWRWLISGRPPMHTDTSVDNSHLVTVASREPRPGYVRLPLLSTEASMGNGVMDQGQVEVVEYLDVAEWWAAQHLPRDPAHIRVITARGDSMAGVINDGDVVFVDIRVNHFQGEGLYVFNWQGRALVKRLVPSIRSGQIQIVSANPAYPSETVSMDEMESLYIAGKVVAWWTLKRH